VKIAALRLFGKLGNLPSNLDASGADLGYSTFDVSAYRMTHTFNYAMANGWDASASLMIQQNVDTRKRKNGSFRAVLLGLQGLLGQPNADPSTFRYYNPFSTSALNCVNRVCTDPGAADNPNLGDYPNAQWVADTIDINPTGSSRPGW